MHGTNMKIAPRILHLGAPWGQNDMLYAPAKSPECPGGGNGLGPEEQEKLCPYLESNLK